VQNYSPQHKANPAASSNYIPERDRKAERVMSDESNIQCQELGKAALDFLGVWGTGCSDSLIWNWRGPT